MDYKYTSLLWKYQICVEYVLWQICSPRLNFRVFVRNVKKPLLKYHMKNGHFIHLFTQAQFKIDCIQNSPSGKKIRFVVLFALQIRTCLHFGIGLVDHTWLYQAARRAHSSSRPHSLPLWKGSHALYSPRSQRCQKYRHAFTRRRLCQSFLSRS